MARALWIEAAATARLRQTVLRPPEPGEVQIVTRWGAISRGTERKVFHGLVPAEIGARMRAPLQEGEFPFPVKYGYCTVGQVEIGPQEWLGRMVFCLHPHQDRFNAPLDMIHALPASLPPRRAVLAANMETALNALWDSGAGPGDRITVIGAGTVGLLVASLAARLPGAEVTVVDVEPARRDIVLSLGARFAIAGEFKPAEAADVVFHASATARGLAAALACAGQEATIVELSWFDDAAADVSALFSATHFHVGRLRLISSQVGEIPAARRPRWTYARRLAKALELLDDPRLDALITEDVPFADLAEQFPRILAPGAAGLTTAINYGEIDVRR